MGSHVCIVMATLDGAAHLRAQLSSIAAQDHGDWSLVVGDDGSRDATPEIVAAFARDHPGRDVAWLPRREDRAPRGSAANFLRSAEAAPPGAWLAFCDQDDVWMPDRLSRALAVLEAAGPGPGGAGAGRVYASRTVHCDAGGRPGRASRLHARGPFLGNAFVQNILAGNTLVLDPAAAAWLRAGAQAARVAGVAHHDWWVYLQAMGLGARVANDARPGLFYRQHGANAMGAHRGAGAALDRAGRVRAGAYAAWMGANLAAMREAPLDWRPEARAMARLLEAWRAGAARSFAEPRRAGLRRQTRSGDLMLEAMARAGWLTAR
ncbi:MAG: glycosyltransferase [Hasllibacter sp.]